MTKRCKVVKETKFYTIKMCVKKGKKAKESELEVPELPELPE